MAVETNVELATRHAVLFEEVRQHTIDVIRRRRLGGDWDAPENQYRNAWAEARARDAVAHQTEA